MDMPLCGEEMTVAKDTVIFVTSIIALVVLGVVVAAVDMSAERLAVLRGIIDILAVVLGVSGRVAVPTFIRRLREGGW